MSSLFLWILLPDSVASVAAGAHKGFDSSHAVAISSIIDSYRSLQLNACGASFQVVTVVTCILCACETTTAMKTGNNKEEWPMSTDPEKRTVTG